jgi:catechol 2,3-dioxygenase-like lactoylglutathione lyase family enzyme
MSIDLAAINADRERIQGKYLMAPDQRPPSSARGVHHIALLSQDVRRTIEFYQGLLGFPLTEIFENRDYPGSNHFFFDIGNGNLLAFFDFPGLDLGPYAEVLGGLHHLAIAVPLAQWALIQDRLTAADVEYVVHGETSMYFSDPDGTRLELNANPLGSQ